MDYKENDNELIYLIREDNEEAFDMLFNKYKPLMIKFSNKYKYKYEMDDMLQECRLGFCKAIETYDETKSVLFSTYLYRCIEKSVLTYLKQMNCKNNKPLIDYVNIDSLPTKYIAYCKTPYDELEEKEYISFIRNFINGLEFDEAIVFELKLNGYSYQVIGDILDMSKKKVDNILAKTRRNFKKYVLNNEVM